MKTTTMVTIMIMAQGLMDELPREAFGGNNCAGQTRQMGLIHASDWKWRSLAASLARAWVQSLAHSHSASSGAVAAVAPGQIRNLS